MAETDRIIEELERVVPGRLVKEITPYQKDWWPLLNLDTEVKGSAIAAVKPQNVDELVNLVNFASSNEVALNLRGGGSSVTGASIPSEGGVVVDMSAMNQILDVDEANMTAIIQSGARLKDVETKLNAKGFTFAQFPQSLDLATIGGYISTMGTGQYSTLLGSIEDAVLRLEIVLPTGEVIWTKKRDSPRSSMGPDLSKLFIGAEGIFGIVAAAELKIRKNPKHVWKAAYGFTTFESALNISKSLMSLDVKPAICRIHNELESMFQYEQESCVMLLVYNFESESVQDAIKNEVSMILEPTSKILRPELVDRWLERRFNFREEIESLRKMGYEPETIEIGVKWSRLFELYVDALRSLEVVKEVSGVGAHVSHLYDQGACIYFTVLLEPKKEAYWRIWEVMGHVAKNHDATLSHHHGVGILKKVYLKDEVPTKLLEKIKDAVDPQGVVNPGRLV